MSLNRQPSISLAEIKITAGFWSGRVELIAKEVIPYQWEALNDTIPGAEPSHALENFRIAAGERTGEFHGMIFQDSDVAKWIEAASYSLATHPDADLGRKIDTVIGWMEKAQQPDGYLNTYFTVAKPEGRWKDFRSAHELYCAGHLMEAAVAYYEATGKRKLLDIMCRYADYIDSVIGPEPHKMRVYCGHPEIELALIKLYRATGVRRYLELSRYFIDERGKQPSFFTKEPGFSKSDPWFNLDYHQAHAPVRQQVTAEGHAVRAMYLYSAMADLALENSDETLVAGLKKLWENVTGRRMYITGGLGSQGYGERFTFDYDLPNDTAYAETCATIGLIFWAQRMFRLDPDRKYTDVMERALYNGALSGISLDGMSYFYVNPLEVFPEAAARRHDLEHVKPERRQWFGCACCPPNIARLIGSLGQYIYSREDERLYVHLYIGNEARFSMHGTPVSLKLQTDYPWDGRIILQVHPEQPVSFALGLRIPGWCRKFSLAINGAAVARPVLNGGYLFLEREWSAGDQVELVLDMPVELMQANPLVREDAGRVAIERGPLVYCLEETDNGANLPDISMSREAEFEVEYAPDLLGGITVIKGKAGRAVGDGWDNALYQPVNTHARLHDRFRPVTVTAIPYAFWGNRIPGEMLVWIRLNG
ncbi:MAG TPA: beta-L-arabinofuranosidase domain-containing protein [Bacillota bacterium]